MSMASMSFDEICSCFHIPQRIRYSSFHTNYHLIQFVITSIVVVGKHRSCERKGKYMVLYFFIWINFCFLAPNKHGSYNS